MHCNKLKTKLPLCEFTKDCHDCTMWPYDTWKGLDVSRERWQNPFKWFSTVDSTLLLVKEFLSPIWFTFCSLHLRPSNFVPKKNLSIPYLLTCLNLDTVYSRGVGGWRGHCHQLFILTFILGYNDLFIKWLNKSNKKRVFRSNWYCYTAWLIRWT